MNLAVSSLLNQSRSAVTTLRRAAPARSWRPRYRRFSRFGMASLERLREAGGQHPRLTVVIGAGTAAVAAGTVYVFSRPGLPYADVLADEQPFRVSTLEDLKGDDDALALVQRELLAEWGPFGPRDMDEMRLMVRNAGRLVYVIRFYEDGELGPPSGVLQTALAPVGGEPERLLALYPNFEALTAGGTWAASPAMRGDTAILLQITAFGDRSRGVGGRLRDTALYMLPDGVRFALTTTPVPPGFDLGSDPESQPATRFHYRGGARPAGGAPGFKTPSPERRDVPPGRQANEDVVFMRYRRLDSGEWEGVPRPDMRLRHHAVEIPLAPVVRSLRPRLARSAQPFAA